VKFQKNIYFEIFVSQKLQSLIQENPAYFLETQKLVPENLAENSPAKCAILEVMNRKNLFRKNT